MLSILIVSLFTDVNTIKVIKMPEDLDSVNNPSNAIVKNFDLGHLSEITICMRVYFYHFPVKSKQDLKWFPIFSSSSGGDILFSVGAFDTGRKSGDLYSMISKGIFHSKDLKNIVSINRTFKMIRYSIKDSVQV